MSMVPIVGLDMEGREVRVGDEVYVAVTSYRSGKLTKALVEQIEDLTAMNGEGYYAYRFHVKTIPGNRRTKDWTVVKVQP